MKITWLGHSALRLEGSRIVFIDPFPHIRSSPQEFKKWVGPASEVIILQPGGTVEI